MKEDTNQKIQKRHGPVGQIFPNSLYPDLWITEKAIKKIKELPENNRWILWVSYVGPHEPFDTQNLGHQTRIYTLETKLKRNLNGYQILLVAN